MSEYTSTTPPYKDDTKYVIEITGVDGRKRTVTVPESLVDDIKKDCDKLGETYVDKTPAPPEPPPEPPPEATTTPPPE